MLVGTEKAMQESFGSSCHGAGRAMSRSRALKAGQGRWLKEELESEGVIVRAKDGRTLAEEMPDAYKDVRAVTDVMAAARLSRKVARLVPIGVVKGVSIGSPKLEDRSMEIQLPKSWLALRKTLGDRPGTVMVVGPVHVGKSTFIRWLANESVAAGARTAILDADVGQSHVGPPGTIGLATVKRPFQEYAELVPTALAFVGALSPAGSEEPAVNGLARLLKLARRQGHQLLIVNTTGYVATEFKLSEVRAVQPDHLVCMHHGVELDLLEERVRSEMVSVQVHDAVAAEKAKKKSEQMRAEVREEAFVSYFRTARVWEIRPVQARVQSVRGPAAPWIAGTLVGLLDGTGVCHGIGIAMPLSRDGLFRVFSPIATTGNIHRILMGAYVVPEEKLKAWTARPTASTAE
ncbi:MAG: Clp1/GlmU family protein [Candidatus Xenobia bacterium]